VTYILIHLIYIENMQMKDRSWMYQSGDMLAHFKDREIIYEHLTLSGFMDN
jgi:hypothetical protein